jgi:hypothetical protein
MTNKQINEAIAKACGWEHKPVNCGGADYCNDLNAMHEAEKVLAPKNWNNFSENWHNYYMHLRRGDADRAIHATARQRAEAFLRTLDKWEEAE